jgi:CheY-like chemotaxis protein
MTVTETQAATLIIPTQQDDMQTIPKTILIVDDNAKLRHTLTLIFTYAGYGVRCAIDGFSALAEMRSNVPAVLLSDLNMPRMSGFELLSVVRRRFPEVPVIAMSGSFEQDHFPASVAADAFYRKGRGGGGELVELAQRLLATRQPRSREATPPVWISSAWMQTGDKEHIAIACPECLRVFPQPRLGSRGIAGETCCSHCSAKVQLAFVHPVFETDMTGLGRAASSF